MWKVNLTCLILVFVSVGVDGIAAKQPRGCPRIFCPTIKCSSGQAVDQRGCPICACKPFQCPDISNCLLPAFCPNGQARDRSGCLKCGCQPDHPVICRPRVCAAIACPFGRRRRDHRGCETCECECVLPVCAPRPPELECRHGFDTDANGCPTCACRRNPDCRPLICPAVVCPGGFTNDVDSNGCPTNCRCSSLANPRPLCPSFHCQIYCRLPQRQASSRSCRCDCEGISPVLYS